MMPQAVGRSSGATSPNNSSSACSINSCGPAITGSISRYIGKPFSEITYEPMSASSCLRAIAVWRGFSVLAIATRNTLTMAASRAATRSSRSLCLLTASSIGVLQLAMVDAAAAGVHSPAAVPETWCDGSYTAWQLVAWCCVAALSGSTLGALYAFLIIGGGSRRTAPIRTSPPSPDWHEGIDPEVVDALSRRS